MNRLLFSIFLALFCVSNALAQPAGNSDSTLVFKVKTKGFEVTVFPTDTVLWTNFRNPLRITMADGGKIKRVVLQGGTIQRIDSITWSAKVTEGKLATLAVYRRLPGKKEKLAYTQQYTIKTIPPPTLIVCGVKSDSTIDKQQLIEVNKLTTVIEGYDSIPIEIIAFKMIHFTNGEADTLITAGNQFSLPMKTAIHKLKAGNVLYFEEVWAEDYNGKRFLTNNVQLFIDETDKYSVGDRDVTKPKDDE